MSQDDVTAQPWQFGDDDARWAGYLIPGTDVLRNKLGATWHEALRLHEDRLVEQRTIRLLAGEGPRIGYDFTGFQRVHEWLFQDVYEWAGQPRTVNMSKNGLSFLGVDELDEAFQIFTDAVLESDRLRTFPEDEWPRAMAAMCAIANSIHPFREGNGRTQRLILEALAAETGHGLDWDAVSKERNDVASHQARQGEMDMLNEVVAEIAYTLGETPPPKRTAPQSAATHALAMEEDIPTYSDCDQKSPSQAWSQDSTPRLH